MKTEPSPIPSLRSSFVTGLAWIFIAIGSVATLISVVQNILVHTLFPLDVALQAMDNAGIKQHVAPAFAQVFRHIAWLVAAFLLFSVVTLVSSIGLLKRKNVGRIVFIAIMAIAIAWSLSLPFVQYYFIETMFETQPDTALLAKSHFRFFATVVLIVSSVISISFAVLFGWIIRRLTSTAIRREFA